MNYNLPHRSIEELEREMSLAKWVKAGLICAGLLFVSLIIVGLKYYEHTTLSILNGALSAL